MMALRERLYLHDWPNKRDWLYNCLANEINTTHSSSKIYSFLEASLNPISYTTEPSRQKYEYLLEEVNKALILTGLEITR